MDAFWSGFGFKKSKVAPFGERDHAAEPPRSVSGDGQGALRAPQVRYFFEIPALTAVHPDCERGVEDVERPVQGVVGGHAAPVHV
jgi:hypothetical protein